MCKFKARNEALRDVAPDVLLGFITYEDATENDYIVGEVVRTETLSNEQAVADRLTAVQDAPTATALREAFDALHMTPAMQLAKLRAHDGREAELLEELRREFSLRKSHGRRVPAKSVGSAASANAKAETPKDAAKTEKPKAAAPPASADADGADAETAEREPGEDDDFSDIGDDEPTAPNADEIFRI
jgi:hypothetical protein